MAQNTFGIGFVDTFDGTADFFMDVLSKELSYLNFVRDDDTPNILIFGDENFGTTNQKYNPDEVVKVFYTGENRRFWNYQCHFGITFDHIDDNRHFRLPLYVLNQHYLNKRFGWNNLLENRRKAILSKKEFFAGYVQSNPHCEKRNQLVSLINEYRPVMCAGPHMNNTGYVLPRGEDGILHKLNFLGKGKFSLAFENGQSAGYATEKLLEAWLSGSVPIYWGSPTIALDFNPKAFINWHSCLNDHSFMNEIKSLPNHQYEMMLEQPLFSNPHQLDLYKKKLAAWFFDNVIGFYERRASPQWVLK